VPSTRSAGSSSGGTWRGSRSSQTRSALAPTASWPQVERLFGDPSGVRGERTLDRENLLGRPAAFRVSFRSLARHPDGDAVQRRPRGHRPVRAERQRRTRFRESAHAVLLVTALVAEARDGQDRHQRVHLCPQRLHARDHAELREPFQVGVVDQLHVRDHRAAVAGPVGLDRVLDGVERLPHCCIADGMDVDLQSEFIDAAGGLGQAVALPHLHADLIPRVAALLPPGMIVQPRTVGRKQRTRLVLHHAVGEELHRVGGQEGRPHFLDPTTGFRELHYLRIEVARIGVLSKVEPDPQRALPRRFDVGVDVAGLHPGVLHPRHSPGQVVVGGGAEGGDPHAFVALGHDGRHQVDGAPLPQRAEDRAVGAMGDLAEHRVGRVRRDARTFQGHRVDPHGVVVPRP
jgi:hypothetical protein